MMQNANGSTPTGGSPQVRPVLRQFVYQALEAYEVTGKPCKIVHLIHGTWPYGLVAHRLTWLHRWREPLWYQPGSEARADLEQRAGASDGVEYEVFEWSGNNSFAARTEAAMKLIEHLERCSEERPEAVHLLVAHSHGGTVAVEALQRAPHLYPHKVRGVLTMATPFVTLRRPPGMAWERLIQGFVAKIAPYLMLGIPIVAWASINPAPVMSPLATFAYLLAMVVVLVIVIESTGWLPWFPMPGRTHARMVLERSLPSLSPDVPMLAIRAPRDEATLAIELAQVFSLISDRVWWMLVYWPLGALRRRPIVVPLLMCGLVGLFIWWGVDQTREMRGVERGVTVALSTSFLSLAALTVPVLLAFVILVPASVALAVATGLEVMAFVGVLTVDAESLPPGGARQLLIVDLPDSDRERLLMRHSIYALSSTRERIAEWIKTTGCG